MTRNLYGFLETLLAQPKELFTVDGQKIALEGVKQRDAVTLFVSGADVSILHAVIPVRSEKEARHAAPFAIEDDMAAAIEDIHISLGPAHSDIQSPRALHVVSNELMETWSQKLQDIPALHCASLVAEQALLTPDEAYEIDGRCVANISGRAFAIDADMPGEALSGLLKGHAAQPIAPLDFFTLLAQRVEAADNVVDLRQGKYRARSQVQLPSLKQWRLAGALAAGLAVTWLASSWLEVSRLKSETKAIEASIEASYIAAFPDAPKPNNYVRAAAQAITAQGNAGQLAFREVSAALYSALSSNPDAQLLAIRYDRQDSTLIATIAYTAYGNDTALKSTLAEWGFVADLGNARQENSGVVGDVTIRRGAL